MQTNEERIKHFLIKELEKDEHFELASILKLAYIELEETQDFTYYEGYDRGWNTYCTYLRVYVPYENYEFINNHKSIITKIAGELYGKRGSNYLVETFVHVYDEEHEIIEFKINTGRESVDHAIEDAEQYMFNGQYDKAFDRVHTAFHGYLKWILVKYKIEVGPTDNLSKIYNKIHDLIDDRITPQETSSSVKAVVRSANGMINAVNEIRNNYSLAHPNEKIIGKSEAKLVLGLISSLIDYIDGYLG